MPELRFPHIPTGFASGGQLTAWVGQRAYQPSGPEVAGRSHHPPSAFPSPVGHRRSTTCRHVYRTLLAVAPRDRDSFSYSRAEPERRRGHSSPCLKAGVFWPQLR
jgi:hypothetical protein